MPLALTHVEPYRPCTHHTRYIDIYIYYTLTQELFQKFDCTHRALEHKIRGPWVAETQHGHFELSTMPV